MAVLKRHSYVCDRCSKVSNVWPDKDEQEYPKNWQVTACWTIEQTMVSLHDEDIFHLCEPCANEYIEWLNERRDK